MNPIEFNDIFGKDIEKGLKTFIQLFEQLNEIVKAGEGVYEASLGTLKMEIDTINKAMKDLNETAKKKKNYTDQEVDDLKKLASEITAYKQQVEALKKALEEEQQKKKKGNEENEKTIGLLGELKKKLKELENQKGAAKTEEELRDLGVQAKATKEEIARLEGVFKGTAQAATNAAGSYNDLQAKTRELFKELKSLPNAFDATTGAINKNNARAVELQRQIAQNNEALKAFDGSVGVFTRNVGNYQSAFHGLGSAFGEYGTLFTGLATGIGGFMVALDLAVKVFNDMTEAVSETNKELAMTKNIIKDVGVDTDLVTAKIKTLSKSMGVEYADMLETVQIFSKNFGITQLQALELIKNEYIDSGDILTKNLDKVAEYSSKLRASGLTAAQSLNVATEGIRQGVFGENFLMAIEEATLSVREFTKAQEDAVKPLGEAFSKNLKKDVDSGKLNTIQALLAIREQAKKVGLSVTQEQTIIADFLKSGGEALGTIENFYGILDSALKENNQTLTEQQKTLQKNLQIQEEYNKKLVVFSKNFDTLGSTLANIGTQYLTILLNEVNLIIETFKDLFNGIKNLGTEIDNLFGNIFSEAFKKFTDILQSVTKEFKGLTGEGNTLFTLFLKLPKTIIAGLAGVINTLKIFKIELTDNIQTIKDFASGKISFEQLKETTKASLSGLGNAFEVGFNNAFANVSKVIDGTNEKIKENTEGIKTNTTATQDNTKAKKENYLTVEQLQKKQIELQGQLNKELEKGNKLRPEYVEKLRSELEKIEKLLPKTLKAVNTEASPDVALIDKDVLGQIAIQQEQLKQQQIKGLITEEQLKMQLLELDKKRLEVEIAIAKTQGKSTIEVEKLKTELESTNKQIVDNNLFNLKRTLENFKIEQEQLKAKRLKGEITEKDYQDKLNAIQRESINAQIADKERLKDFDSEYYKLKNQLIEQDKEKSEKAFDSIFNVLSTSANKLKDDTLRLLFNSLISIVQIGRDVFKGNKTIGEGAVSFLNSLPQFYEGGFTGEGAKFETAGVVHKGEYVVNKELLQRPDVFNAVKAIENIRVGVNTDFYGQINDRLKPIVIAPQSTPLIDYNQLGKAIASNTNQIEFDNIKDYIVLSVKQANNMSRVKIPKPKKSL